MKRKAKVLFFYISQTSGLHFLLGKRKAGAEEYWWLPGGTVEENEGHFQALERELNEELQLSAYIKKVIENYSSSKKQPPCLKYKIENSENRIYLIRLKAYPEIKKDIPGIKEEFEELKWINKRTIPKNMSREFKHIARKINKNFLSKRFKKFDYSNYW